MFFTSHLKGIRSIFVLLMVLTFASCSSTKYVPYFQDINQKSAAINDVSSFNEPRIQADDILSIAIFTTDPNSSLLINQLAGQASIISALNQTPPQATNGILVDKDGNVDLPVLGKIKVEQLTTYQAKELILQKASVIYQKPSVQVRFSNFKITVLGEVSKPATYVIPNEKVSVLDALGLAGDLTIFGRRENVLLVRENGGKKEYARLDLNSSTLFSSPYFYLKQNDVLYVEPNKGKAASLNQARTQTIAIIGSALSVLVVIFTR